MFHYHKKLATENISVYCFSATQGLNIRITVRLGGWGGGGGGGSMGVADPPPFEICAPFFKNQKTKIIKNWEKLSEGD